MNVDTKWLIFGLVLVVVVAAMFVLINHTTTTNNTERDRIRTEAGIIGPFEGSCVVNSAGSQMVLSCEFELDSDNTE